MNGFFRRQLALYAEYHRDLRNRVTHYLAMPAVFVAVLLPLSLWRIPLGSLDVSLAMLLLIPAIIGWIALDAGIGIALLAAIVPLVLITEMIARIAPVGGVLSIAALLLAAGIGLLFVGHAVFERRKPALADNLFQVFIGPMFVMAEIMVALGLRPDLVAAMQNGPAANTGSRAAGA
jgi:uncharacterized membrane protein YGL010W